MDGLEDGRMDGKMDGQTNIYIYGWMGRLTDGWMILS